jgi:hypothetical protein
MHVLTRPRSHGAVAFWVHAQDLEILKGYVPGFDGVLGHECVAKVVACPSQPDLVGEWQSNRLCWTCASVGMPGAQVRILSGSVSWLADHHPIRAE